jgi:single-strand DNA-binding protein
MLGLNKVEILGNLGGTPELRFLNENNDQVVNFSVAVNERYRNRQNQMKERVTWFRVVAFNGLGQVCAEHLRKGDGVYVEGRLQVREYESKGEQHTAVEVVAQKVRFLSRAGHVDGEEKRPTPGQPKLGEAGAATDAEDGASYDGSGDVPF